MFEHEHRSQAEISRVAARRHEIVSAVQDHRAQRRSTRRERGKAGAVATVAHPA